MAPALHTTHHTPQERGAGPHAALDPRPTAPAPPPGQQLPPKRSTPRRDRYSPTPRGAETLSSNSHPSREHPLRLTLGHSSPRTVSFRSPRLSPPPPLSLPVERTRKSVPFPLNRYGMRASCSPALHGGAALLNSWTEVLLGRPRQFLREVSRERVRLDRVALRGEG